MGDEFAQDHEWNHNVSLNWSLLQGDLHRGMQNLVRDLNKLYCNTDALHELDTESRGFEWIDVQDRDGSVVSWLRRARDGRHVVCISNFTPVVRHDYRVGVPDQCAYTEQLNTDATHYGGSGVTNAGSLRAESLESHSRPASLRLTLPPLATIILQPA